MAVKQSEICTVKEGGLSLKGYPGVAAEASRFESILKEAFGEQKHAFPSLFLSAQSRLGREMSDLYNGKPGEDNEGLDIFRNAVFEQVAQDLAHDRSMPAHILKGPIAPYLSIRNNTQDKDRAVLPEVNLIMNINCRD
jgi:hypothetical protein